MKVIDTHTGGEPTRIIVEGGPDLGSGTMAERREVFRSRFDHIRSATVNEPRGSDVMVGAILQEPTDSDCVAGVIFFNNVGYLHMCGHGTMGVAVALAHLGRIGSGTHALETPVGRVTFEFHGRGQVTIQNVPSYRIAERVKVDVPGHGPVHGDIAWGGNWFFLVEDHGQDLSLTNAEQLTRFTWDIRRSLHEAGITGENGGEIDHIELFGPPIDAANNSRNFVLCPGGAYDRSPCGTGTSAKIACLAAAGKLKPGDKWRQESVVGSLFEGTYLPHGNHVLPQITGTAYVNGEMTVIFDENDPFRFGIVAR